MSTYTGPNGWTADSVVGAINAAAQAPITADTLLTSRSAARDPALASRQYMNPYTGVRDPVLQGSVYANTDTPAWLAGEVAALNAEQAMRRSAQAEIFNKIFGQAQVGGPEGLPWLEVLRAAVLQPGVEAGFGSQVVDPNIGIAANKQAEANQTAAGAYANTLNDAITQRSAALQAASRGDSSVGSAFWMGPPPISQTRNTAQSSRSADSVAQSVIGTNPFAAARGYIGGTGSTSIPASNNSGPFASSRLDIPGYAEQYGFVRPPATDQAYSWGGGYVGPTQFSQANPAYNAYAGSNFLVR